MTPHRRLFALLLILLPVPVLAALAPPRPGEPWPPAAQAGDPARAFAEARKALEAGDTAAAREHALAGLSLAPWTREGYALLLACAEKDGDTEGVLRWGKWLWWSQAYTGEAKAAGETAARLQALTPSWDLDQAAVEAWIAEVRDAVRAASGSAKQYRLAGYLLGKLLDLQPGDPGLNKEFDALYDRAGSLAGGGAFTAARVRRRSPAFIAEQNRLHRDWQNPFRRKTAHYEILTNVSYEFFETVSVVMEDMYDFYQKIYDYKKKAPRVTLAIHRRRSDFDRYCQEELGRSLPLGVGGWFYDRKMTVAAYDRSETGTDLSDLWRVLFHEASHQFMYLLTEKKTKQDPPTWLNEGTASYFEGCELKADGSIVKNKPALNRILEWQQIERGRNAHTLEELVKCPHRSYDGSFYSYGWALVYFLNNYENADGDLVYRDAYLKYLRSYTRKGPKDPAEALEESYRRAYRFFVEEIDDPEVPDWQAFEDRWREYTRKIAREAQAGPEFATELQERCKRYLERGDFERALIAAEQADDKRPEDAETYRLLALASLGAGRPEDAVYWMVRHWERAWGAGDEEAAARAEEWLAAHDGEGVLQHYVGPTRRLQEAVREAMDAARGEGHPVLAMLFASHALQALGFPHADLEAALEELRELSGHDLRLWTAAFHGTPEDNVVAGGREIIRYDPDGVLVFCPEGRFPTSTLSDDPRLRWLAPPFDLRGTIQVDGRNGAVIALGVSADGTPRSALRFQNGATVRLERIDVAFELENQGARSLVYQPVASLRLDPVQKFVFELRAGREGGELLVAPAPDALYPEGRYAGEARPVEGRKTWRQPLPSDWSADRLSGQLGIAADQDTAALFSGLEVRISRPFWPVPPRE